MKIQIDEKLDRLTKQAMKITGYRTERGVIHAGLRLLMKHKIDISIKKHKRKIGAKTDRAMTKMVQENDRLGLYDEGYRIR